MEDAENLEAKGNTRRLLSRDLNYLRDVALFWPFVLFLILGMSATYPVLNRMDALRFGAVAIVAVLLAKEKYLMFFTGIGFIGIQGAFSLLLHPWNWSIFAIAILAATSWVLGMFLWKRTHLSYEFPADFGAVDMLVCVASLCASFGLLYAISPSN